MGGGGCFGSPGGGGQPVLKEHVAVQQHKAAVRDPPHLTISRSNTIELAVFTLMETWLVEHV